MIRLERSEVLKRKTRKDDLADLVVSNFDVVSQAVKAGKTTGEVLDFLDYARQESQSNNDSFVVFVDSVLTYLADNLGEEAVYKALKPRYLARMTEFLETTRGAVEVVQRLTESQRRHHANISVAEEADRYVLTYNPCGSGGRLRRTKNVAVTKKAYPWSWGKAGVPYYCTHCCVNWEMIAVELRGFPARITLVGEKPEDPCIHLIYKKPELIPEEYFNRIGMKKDPAKFKE